MPGKQMAIDADLSAGLINEDEAQDAAQGARGRELASTAPWTAPRNSSAATPSPACSITFINIVGGIIIGVAQQGHRASPRRRAPTRILTVGDGLVSQIPALIVSTAAGLLVSKAGVSRRRRQGARPSSSPAIRKALGMSAAVMGVDGLAARHADAALPGARRRRRLPGLRASRASTRPRTRKTAAAPQGHRRPPQAMRPSEEPISDRAQDRRAQDRDRLRPAAAGQSPPTARTG